MSRFDLPLLRCGALLLLIGLVTGAFVTGLRLPRLGLSAHLTGMSNGMMLMVLALVWPLLNLPRAWSNAGRYLAMVSLPGIWLALTLAAAVGAGGAAPLVGGTASAGPVWDAVAYLLIAAMSVLALIAAVILTAGLLRIRAPEGSKAQTTL